MIWYCSLSTRHASNHMVSFHSMKGSTLGLIERIGRSMFHPNFTQTLSISCGRQATRQ